MKRTHSFSAGIIVLNSDKDKVLLLYKKKHRNWEYPKGKIELGESELTTARRELKEETGVKEINIVRNFKKKIFYNFKAKGELILKTVTFFLGYTNNKARISNEHDAFCWCTFAQARKRFRHRNYKNLLTIVETHLKKNIKRRQVVRV